MLEGPNDRDNQQKPNTVKGPNGSLLIPNQFSKKGSGDLDPDWVAGLVDAEGYFTIHKREKKNQWAFAFGIRMNVRGMSMLKRL